MAAYGLPEKVFNEQAYPEGRSLMRLRCLPAALIGLLIAPFCLADDVMQSDVNGPSQLSASNAHTMSGQIAYATRSNEGAGKTVYQVKLLDVKDGTTRVATSANHIVMSPRLSPDGRKIAFSRFEGSDSDIIILTLATGEEQRIASKPHLNGAAAWSPDGTRIAYANSAGGKTDIYIINLQNGKTEQLTDATSINTEPAWAPDGQSIAFTSDRNGRPQIFVERLVDRSVNAVSAEDLLAYSPKYSLDGKSLVFSGRNKEGYKIYLVGLADDSISSISPGPMDMNPDFSPDGQYLVYSSSGRLVLSSANGAQSRELTNDEAREPSWSPMP